MAHEYRCRVCDGAGLVYTAEQTSSHPADIRELELDCPDCKGDGTVDQDMHDEQVQYVDNYYETACREALELHWEEVAEDRCRYA